MKHLLRVVMLIFISHFCVPGVYTADTLVWRQPGPGEGMDFWLGSMSGYENPIHDGRILFGGANGYEFDGYLRFDLSGLPQVANRALIWVYTIPAQGALATPIACYLPLTQWQANTIRWNNQPTLQYLGTNPDGSEPGGQPTWYWIDITTQFNEWRVGRNGSQVTLNYGYKLAPKYTNNRYTIFNGSGISAAWARPYLYVYYTPQAEDSKIKLKWPLSSTYPSRVVNQPFGSDWSTGVKCDGIVKKHNGTDFRASPGTFVYAGEDGVVKEVHYDSSGLWAYNIVLEHNHPQGGKYTTVYWHVENVLVSVGQFIPKAYSMATVANLGANSHFHFGIRVGSYVSNLSGTGALPQSDCGGYPAFPAGFIDPNDTRNVVFQ